MAKSYAFVQVTDGPVAGVLVQLPPETEVTPLSALALYARQCDRITTYNNWVRVIDRKLAACADIAPLARQTFLSLEEVLADLPPGTPPPDAWLVNALRTAYHKVKYSVAFGQREGATMFWFDWRHVTQESGQPQPPVTTPAPPPAVRM